MLYRILDLLIQQIRRRLCFYYVCFLGINSECANYFKHCRFKNIELCGDWMLSGYAACRSMEECIYFTWEGHRTRIRENTG